MQLWRLFEWLPRLGMFDLRRAKQFYRDNPALVRALKKHRLPIDLINGPSKWVRTEREPEMVAAVVEALQDRNGIKDPIEVAIHLGATRTPFDGSFFIELYNDNTEYLKRNTIICTAIQTHATGITDWLRDLLRDPDAGDIRDSIAFMADLLRDKTGLMDDMKDVFELYPRAVIDYMAKYGKAEELEYLTARRDFLEALPNSARKDLKTPYKHALAMIEKRLAREAVRAEARAAKEADKQRLRAEAKRMKAEEKAKKLH